jgi:hypothetical protein
MGGDEAAEKRGPVGPLGSPSRSKAEAQATSTVPTSGRSTSSTGAVQRDRPWFSAIPTLTAAALVTARIRLGTLVASPNFRHPLTLAKEIVTLDDIATGRVTLGLGPGTVKWFSNDPVELEQEWLDPEISKEHAVSLLQPYPDGPWSSSQRFRW